MASHHVVNRLLPGQAQPLRAREASPEDSVKLAAKSQPMLRQGTCDWFQKEKPSASHKDKSKNIARITGIVDGDSFTASVKGEEKTICVANADPRR